MGTARVVLDVRVNLDVGTRVVEPEPPGYIR